MNNLKRRFISLCSTIFVLMLVLSTASVSATQGNIWTTKAPMSIGRYNHKATALNGKIYVIGGYDGKIHTNSVEEYNPKANTWTTKAPMTTARNLHQAVVLDGKIYVIGGSGNGVYLNSVEEYNPATNKWTIKASMTTARYLHQVTIVGGKIYAIGGQNTSGYLNSVEEYDPATNKWTIKASMPTARRCHGLVVIGGKIYAMGGQDGSGSLNLVEEYDPEKNTWTVKTPMAVGRYNFGAILVDGKIYTIGGYDGKNSLNSVEEYSPATNIWTTKAAMTTTRSLHQTAVIGGKIYVIGGYDGKSSTNSVEEYNPATNIWTTRVSMATARYIFETALVNEKIYAVGGYNGSDFFKSLEEYTLEYSAKVNDFIAIAVNSQVNLSWTAPKDATSYYIKRSTTAGGTFDTIATTSDTTYKDITVKNGNTYYYVVSAVNASNVESANSSGVTAKPADIIKEPLELEASATNGSINLSWIESEDATSYNIKRSTTAGGTYATIATASAITYTDTTAVNGTTYYYVVSAVNSAGESANSNEVAATLSNSEEMLEVVSIDKAKVGDEITANIVIHNAVNICAEDIKIAFDTSKLQFISAEGADGIKIFKEDVLTEGIKRYITASLGKANAANGNKTLLKLTFKAKASGEAKIDITSGRIADNATIEKDIKYENCGEKIILIERNLMDVNRSGEFSLLDLGINAWYYGDAVADTDTTKYDADVVENGTIDDDDLTEIVKQILNNSNYPASANV